VKPKRVAVGNITNLELAPKFTHNLLMNLTLFYVSDQELGTTGDPLYLELLSVCQSKENDSMHIQYYSTIYMRGLSNIGVKPVLTSSEYLAVKKQ